MAQLIVCTFLFIITFYNQIANSIQTPIVGKAPEDIDCPRQGHNVYGNAIFSQQASLEWEQRRESWLTMDAPSRSIVDCIQQCYGYRFCYSIRYLKKLKKSCRMYMHSNDDCKGKLMLSASKISQRVDELKADRIIVECLNCMKNDVGIATMSNSMDMPKKSEKPTPPEIVLASNDQTPTNVNKRLASNMPVNAKNTFSQNDQPLRNSAEAVTHGMTHSVGIEDQDSREQRQIWRACLVTFEILSESQTEEALRGMKLAKTASVTSLNECAFICYQNACSNVLFELTDSEEKPSKCHLDIESNKETCSPNLQRHYSYPNINRTMISCVRCVAHKPTTISPDAEIVPKKSTPITGENLPTTMATTQNIPTFLTTTEINDEPATLTSKIIPEKESSVTTNEEEVDTTTTTFLVAQELKSTQTSAPELQEEIEGFRTTSLIQATEKAIIETETKLTKEEATTDEEETILSSTEKQIAEEKIPILPIIIVNEHDEDDANSTERPKSVGLALPSKEKSTETTEEPSENESTESIHLIGIIKANNGSESEPEENMEESNTTSIIAEVEVKTENESTKIIEKINDAANASIGITIKDNEETSTQAAFIIESESESSNTPPEESSITTTGIGITQSEPKGPEQFETEVVKSEAQEEAVNLVNTTQFETTIELTTPSHSVKLEAQNEETIQSVSPNEAETTTQSSSSNAASPERIEETTTLSSSVEANVTAKSEGELAAFSISDGGTTPESAGKTEEAITSTNTPIEENATEKSEDELAALPISDGNGSTFSDETGSTMPSNLTSENEAETTTQSINLSESASSERTEEATKSSSRGNDTLKSEHELAAVPISDGGKTTLSESIGTTVEAITSTNTPVEPNATSKSEHELAALPISDGNGTTFSDSESVGTTESQKEAMTSIEFIDNDTTTEASPAELTSNINTSENPANGQMGVVPFIHNETETKMPAEKSSTNATILELKAQNEEAAESVSPKQNEEEITTQSSSSESASTAIATTEIGLAQSETNRPEELETEIVKSEAQLEGASTIVLTPSDVTMESTVEATTTNSLLVKSEDALSLTTISVEMTTFVEAIGTTVEATSSTNSPVEANVTAKSEDELAAAPISEKGTTSEFAGTTEEAIISSNSPVEGNATTKGEDALAAIPISNGEEKTLSESIGTTETPSEPISSSISNENETTITSTPTENSTEDRIAVVPFIHNENEKNESFINDLNTTIEEISTTLSVQFETGSTMPSDLTSENLETAKNENEEETTTQSNPSESASPETIEESTKSSSSAEANVTAKSEDELAAIPISEGGTTSEFAGTTEEAIISSNSPETNVTAKSEDELAAAPISEKGTTSEFAGTTEETITSSSSNAEANATLITEDELAALPIFDGNGTTFSGSFGTTGSPEPVSSSSAIENDTTTEASSVEMSSTAIENSTDNQIAVVPFIHNENGKNESTINDLNTTIEEESSTTLLSVENGSTMASNLTSENVETAKNENEEETTTQSNLSESASPERTEEATTSSSSSAEANATLKTEDELAAISISEGGGKTESVGTTGFHESMSSSNSIENETTTESSAAEISPTPTENSTDDRMAIVPFIHNENEKNESIITDSTIEGEITTTLSVQFETGSTMPSDLTSENLETAKNENEAETTTQSNSSESASPETIEESTKSSSSAEANVTAKSEDELAAIPISDGGTTLESIGTTEEATSSTNSPVEGNATTKASEPISSSISNENETTAETSSVEITSTPTENSTEDQIAVVPFIHNENEKNESFINDLNTTIEEISTTLSVQFETGSTMPSNLTSENVETAKNENEAETTTQSNSSESASPETIEESTKSSSSAEANVTAKSEDELAAIPISEGGTTSEFAGTTEEAIISSNSPETNVTAKSEDELAAAPISEKGTTSEFAGTTEETLTSSSSNAEANATLKTEDELAALPIFDGNGTTFSGSFGTTGSPEPVSSRSAIENDTTTEASSVEMSSTAIENSTDNQIAVVPFIHNENGKNESTINDLNTTIEEESSTTLLSVENGSTMASNLTSENVETAKNENEEETTTQSNLSESASPERTEEATTSSSSSTEANATLKTEDELGALPISEGGITPESAGTTEKAATSSSSSAEANATLKTEDELAAISISEGGGKTESVGTTGFHESMSSSNSIENETTTESSAAEISPTPTENSTDDRMAIVPFIHNENEKNESTINDLNTTIEEISTTLSVQFETGSTMPSNLTSENVETAKNENEAETTTQSNSSESASPETIEESTKSSSSAEANVTAKSEDELAAIPISEGGTTSEFAGTTEEAIISSSSPETNVTAKSEDELATAPISEGRDTTFSESVGTTESPELENDTTTEATAAEITSSANPSENPADDQMAIVPFIHNENENNESITNVEEIHSTFSVPLESGSTMSSTLTSENPETTNELSSTTSNPALISDLINAVSQLVDIVKLHPTTPEPTVNVVSNVIDFMNNNISIGDIRQHNPPGFDVKQCHGEIGFKGELLTDYTQSFEIILASDTVYECVKTCFQLNCTRAAYTHFPRSACLLHFSTMEEPLETKCTQTEELVSTWEFKKVPEVLNIVCIKCSEEKGPRNERILRDEFSLDNFRHILDTPPQHIINPQGVTHKCNGRVEFVTYPVPDLHLLNITNDLPADTPSDCARKCFEEENCKIAGFIPTPGHESAGGICLVTTNFNEKCSNEVRHTPQHASTVPFLIECIRCSECNYTLSLVDSEHVILDYEQTLPVETVGECAEKCAAKSCSTAQFDPNKLMCSFTANQSQGNCPIESGLQTDGIFPISLNCIKCA